MKNYVLLIMSFIFLMISSQSVSQNNDSSILKSEKPNFKIEFPSNYNLEESNIDKGLKSDLYRCEFNNDIYMLKYTEHKNPAVSGDNEVYMGASLESFITGIKATLINKSKIKYGKTTGLDAYLSLDNKSMNVFYRVLILKRTQYQIIVITKSKDKTVEINSFFNSFISPAK